MLVVYEHLITGKQVWVDKGLVAALLFGPVTCAQNTRLPGILPFLSTQLCPSTGLDLISLVLYFVRDLGGI